MNKNGTNMIKFLENKEVKTLNDSVQKPEPEWTINRQCLQKGRKLHA